jgi:hypothetical protein
MWSRPTASWNEEEMLDSQIRMYGEGWLRQYTWLFSEESVNRLNIGPRTYLEFYNTPQMKWFLETPNVNSYEEQIRVRAEYLKGKIDYRMDLACTVNPPVGGPNGATPKCADSWESWFEQPPAEWTKCQPDGPVVRPRGSIGTKWGALRRIQFPIPEIHVATDGRVDSYNLTKKFPQPIYTVTQNTRCYFEPVYEVDETVKSIPYRKGQEAPAMGLSIGCVKTAGVKGMAFEAVSVDGQTCWLEMQLIKSVKKRK